MNIESNEQSGVMYKKMSINDKYRTKDVKRLILEKFFLNADTCDKYTLVQILGPNGGELVINDDCNVFYAAKTLPDMHFVLRSKDKPHSTFSSFAGFNETGSNGSAVFGQNNGLQNQAKFLRHSMASLSHSSTGSFSQLPPRSHPKSSSKWWLKKILS